MLLTCNKRLHLPVLFCFLVASSLVSAQGLNKCLLTYVGKEVSFSSIATQPKDFTGTVWAYFNSSKTDHVEVTYVGGSMLLKRGYKNGKLIVSTSLYDGREGGETFFEYDNKTGNLKRKTTTSSYPDGSMFRKVTDYSKDFVRFQEIIVEADGIPRTTSEVMARLVNGDEVVVSMTHAVLNKKTMIESRTETFYSEHGYKVWEKQQRNLVAVDPNTPFSMIPQKVIEPLKITFADSAYVKPGASWKGGDGGLYVVLNKNGKMVLELLSPTKVDDTHVIKKLEIGLNGLQADRFIYQETHTIDADGKLVDHRTMTAKLEKGELVSFVDSGMPNTPTYSLENGVWITKDRDPFKKTH